AGDHYVYFSDLMRRARQISPIVPYGTSTNLKALRELSEENLIVTWGGSSGYGKISSPGSMCRQRGAKPVHLTKSEEENEPVCGN
ncbi:MAG: hypothetical protein WCA15_11820, partial [Candidatus Acidiferrales bacterium]